MSQVAALSDEILMMIFNKIESLQQLATCRLVRKAWKSPAASVMFSREIVVDSELKAIRVHRHLLLDSAKAKLITNMRFKFDGSDIPLMVEELLELAITPSIKTINGTVKSDKFFTKIFIILDNASQPYDKLESLPKYTGKNKDIKDDMVWIFSRRLCTTMLLGLRDDLSRYQKLEHLTIRGDTIGLKPLEKTLNSCLRVSHLVFKDFSLVGSVEKMSAGDVKTWCQANVQKNNKCKQMNIHTVCYPQLLEYLSYKYPLGRFFIKGELKSIFCGRTFPKDELKRILDVDRIRSIRLILPASTKVKDLASFFKDRNDDYKFCLETNNKNKEELIMDITNYKTRMYNNEEYN